MFTPQVSNSHKDALQQAAGKIDSLARAMDEDRRSFDQQAAELVKESTEELTGKIEELENELKRWDWLFQCLDYCLIVIHLETVLCHSIWPVQQESWNIGVFR